MQETSLSAAALRIPDDFYGRYRRRLEMPGLPSVLQAASFIYAKCPAYCSRPLNRSQEAAPINGSPAFLKFQD